MVYVNARVVEHNFDNAVIHLDSEFESLVQNTQAQSSIFSSSEARLSLTTTSGLLSEADDILVKLDAVLNLAALNARGFLRVLRKLERKTRLGAAPDAVSHIMRLGFAAAAAAGSESAFAVDLDAAAAGISFSNSGSDGVGAAGNRCFALRRRLLYLRRSLRMQLESIGLLDGGNLPP
jgi:hypothetical protein